MPARGRTLPRAPRGAGLSWAGFSHCGFLSPWPCWAATTGPRDSVMTTRFSQGAKAQALGTCREGPCWGR